MTIIKSYTDLQQSKKLAEILPKESADMSWVSNGLGKPFARTIPIKGDPEELCACWSLAALLEYMNRNFYNISLNYCGSEYTISFDDGERYKTITKDYSIDTAFEMIVWLKETNRI